MDGNRANDVIERIRALLKKAPARRDALDVNEAILQVVALLRGEAVKIVAVLDSGPGLDPTKLEQLYEAFYTTKPGSLGMGLSIFRSIVEVHGGRLWAEANEPRGAVFQLILPG